MLECVLGRMRCGEGRALGFSREEGEGEEGLEGARGNMCIVYCVSCIVLCIVYVCVCAMTRPGGASRWVVGPARLACAHCTVLLSWVISGRRVAGISTLEVGGASVLPRLLVLRCLCARRHIRETRETLVFCLRHHLETRPRPRPISAVVLIW